MSQAKLETVRLKLKGGWLNKSDVLKASMKSKDANDYVGEKYSK